jgi:hypothetical protein
MQMMLSRVPREMLEEMLKNMPAETAAAGEDSGSAMHVPVDGESPPAGEASRARTGCC